MGFRQNGGKKRTKHVIYHWKAHSSGNQGNHVAKAECVAFNSYSSPLQRRSPSNIEFLENFDCRLYENIYAYMQALSTQFLLNMKKARKLK